MWIMMIAGEKKQGITAFFCPQQPILLYDSFRILFEDAKPKK